MTTIKKIKDMAAVSSDDIFGSTMSGENEKI